MTDQPDFMALLAELMGRRDVVEKAGNGWIKKCRKKHDRMPDIEGQATIKGVKYTFGGWKGKSKLGQTIYRLSFTEVDERGVAK